MVAGLWLGLVGLWMGLTPWLVLKREFGGVAVLATVWNTVDPQGLGIPDTLSVNWLGGVYGVVWLWLGLAWGCRWIRSPWRRWRWLLGLGVGGLILAGGVAGVFFHAVHDVNQSALAAGIAPNRLPLRRSSVSVGWLLLVAASLGVMAWGRWQLAGAKALLVRGRTVVVPMVALALAIVLGAVMVWILRPGLGLAPNMTVSTWVWWCSKWDLVTYTFQILFQPISQGAGWFQSLVVATPLIFTGLAVAIGFHGGLFNIGAPGQLTMGAVATTLVGVYCPGSRWVVLPLAVAAAAAGGAFWGAIPGWLKARFGTHEVINTIMLNYIAASVFLFLIGSNQYSFFGTAITLPFKAPGGEARSYEIQPQAQIPLLLHLLGFDSGTWHLGVGLAVGGGLLAGLLAGFLGWRRSQWAVGLAGAALGYLGGSLVPGIPIQIPPALATVRLNGAFLLALLALVAVHYLLWHTQAGYELRAMGWAPAAAAYAGVNLSRQTIWVMTLAGALAGLAATHYVLGGGIDEYRLKQSLPVSVGFDGIAVALMGQNQPLGIGLTALLFGVLLTGGLQLNLELGISRELVTALQALIVLFVAAGGFLPRYFTDPLLAAQVEMEAQPSLWPAVPTRQTTAVAMHPQDSSPDATVPPSATGDPHIPPLPADRLPPN
ncbi:MAG: ABC transporter permease [Synechococcales cyanobacterium]